MKRSILIIACLTVMAVSSVACGPSEVEENRPQFSPATAPQSTPPATVLPTPTAAQISQLAEFLGDEYYIYKQFQDYLAELELWSPEEGIILIDPNRTEGSLLFGSIAYNRKHADLVAATSRELPSVVMDPNNYIIRFETYQAVVDAFEPEIEIAIAPKPAPTPSTGVLGASIEVAIVKFTEGEHNDFVNNMSGLEVKFYFDQVRQNELPGFVEDGIITDRDLRRLDGHSENVDEALASGRINEHEMKYWLKLLYRMVDEKGFLVAGPTRVSSSVSDELLGDTATAVRAINGFWSRHWDELFPGSYEGPEVKGGYFGNANPPCGGIHHDGSTNAYYCQPDDYIAWDWNLMLNMYREIGDSWVYFVVAHEWGHAIQARLKSSLVSIDSELQADCLAAAALQGAAKDGILQFEDGDRGEIFTSLVVVADKLEWGNPNDHGSADQRIESYQLGEGGVMACF